MEEPFKLKEMYHRGFIEEFAAMLRAVYPAFESARFTENVFASGWGNLELKARMRRVTECLGAALPAAYPEALALLRRAAPLCVGFPYMFFPDFVEVFGFAPEHEELSLDALELFTQSSSAEFAVRPFIKRNPAKIMARMARWAQSENEHVRRLASEGCRPRLPWAMALPEFQRNPEPILPILETLKRDESEYVRRSVANNLNDIAKDHPDLVLRLAAEWKGEDPRVDWIVKHGCRTLLKRGNAEALRHFGFEDTGAASVENLRALPAALAVGEATRIRFEARAAKAQAARLDMAVDYVKASGKRSRKVFKIAETTFEAGEGRVFDRKLSFRNLTTRKHYPGAHTISIVVNGATKASVEVLVTPERAKDEKDEKNEKNEKNEKK